MQIVSALFADDISVRQAEGGAARIDLSGIQFSAAAPGPFPVTVTPHLIIIVRCPPDEPGTGALEVVFRRDGEQVARNVQPLQVEPGKFAYRLVRGELEYPSAGVVEAHCRIDMGDVVVVPYTLLDPVTAADG
jgi:hypothetical protein